MSYNLASANYSMYGGAGARVSVINMVLQETGTYNDQFRRPYESNMNTDNIQQVIQAAADGGTGVAKMLPSLSMLVVPSSNLMHVASIPNGWFTRRFRFTMVVKTVNPMGLQEMETITGYTEFADQSYSGHIDPNMRFYINSVIRARLGLDGSHYTDSSIVIPGTAHLAPNQQYWKQRPEDVVAGLDASMYSDPNMLGATVVDTRNRLQSTPIMARRVEQVPTLYVANIIKAVNEARVSNTLDNDPEGTDAYGGAVATLKNSYANTGGVLQQFSTMFGMPTNEFTLQDLLLLDPMAAGKITMIPLDNIQAASLHQAGLTAVHDTSPECIAATVAAQSVVSCMSRCGLLVVRFTMDNLSEVIADARYVDTTADISTIAKRTEAFVSTFRREVFNNISYNSQIGVIIGVDADIHGDIVVSISLNGQAASQYVTPAWSDAATTPLITQSSIGMSKLISDVGTLVDNIAHL